MAAKKSKGGAPAKRASTQPASNRARATNAKIPEQKTRIQESIDEFKADSDIYKTTDDPSKLTKPIVDRNGPPQLLALEDRHYYFCKRYVLNGGNGNKTAKECKVNVTHAYGVWLKDPKIKAEIERLRAERRKKFEVNEERIIRELAKLAFSSLGEFINVQEDGTPTLDCSDIGEEEFAALAKFEQESYYEPGATEDDPARQVKKTKIQQHNKLGALSELAKILGIYKDAKLGEETLEDKATKLRALFNAMLEVDGA